MNPSNYYRDAFREHFASFWRSLEARGSASRVRRRLSPSRFSEQAEDHFSVADLVVRPNKGLPDHLLEVPADQQLDFLCALLYTVLIDQVMYSHCRPDYPTFRSLTAYPKMDRTVGFARTLMMANPYELLEDDVVLSRNLRHQDAISRFRDWAAFIVADLRVFFTERAVGSTTWPNVREAMLHDPSVTWGVAGAELTAALEADKSAP